MKKLMTVLSVLMLALFIASACSSPERDGKKAGEMYCEMQELIQKQMDGEDVQEAIEKLEKRMVEFEKEMDGRYDEDDEDAAKKFLEAYFKAMEDC